MVISNTLTWLVSVCVLPIRYYFAFLLLYIYNIVLSPHPISSLKKRYFHFHFNTFVYFLLFLLDSNGPCSKRSCNHHSICVESGDLAFCECPNCGEDYNPVCGGDGVTYDNECKLRRAACLKETDIPIVENAPCSKYKSYNYDIIIVGGRHN